MFDILTKFDPINLIALAIVWWNIKNYMDKRFDKLDEKITDIDRRLCRVEGAMTSKDCCMLKDDGKMKRAE